MLYEHGRAYLEISFMMAQWELGKTSARYVIIFFIQIIEGGMHRNRFRGIPLVF